MKLRNMIFPLFIDHHKFVAFLVVWHLWDAAFTDANFDFGRNSSMVPDHNCMYYPQEYMRYDTPRATYILHKSFCGLEVLIRIYFILSLSLSPLLYCRFHACLYYSAQSSLIFMSRSN